MSKTAPLLLTLLGLDLRVLNASAYPGVGGSREFLAGLADRIRQPDRLVAGALPRHSAPLLKNWGAFYTCEVHFAPMFQQGTGPPGE